MVTNAVGANNTVNPQTPGKATDTVTITEFREASVDIGMETEYSSYINRQPLLAKRMGQAHALYVEDYLLALETGITAVGQIRDVTGSVLDADVLAGVQVLDDNKAPLEGRHYMWSSGQKSALLIKDRFTNVQFIGNRNLPVNSGKIPDLYGCECMMSLRTRRRTIGVTLRTINICWHEDAFVLAMQIKPFFNKRPLDLAVRHISAQRFGAKVYYSEMVGLVRTTDA
jgi:hypothetical protein